MPQLKLRLAKINFAFAAINNQKLNFGQIKEIFIEVDQELAPKANFAAISKAYFKIQLAVMNFDKFINELDKLLFLEGTRKSLG